MSKVILFTLISFFSVARMNAQLLPTVKMETRFGDILIEVDTLNAPLTAKNFLKNVQNGTYENAVFYRVVHMDNQPDNKIKIEVIQGGLFDDERLEKIVPIAHETTEITGIKHLDGTISMARAEPGTASTEFFICVGDQPELDFGGKRNPDGQGFAGFGQVVEGMKVVKEIQKQNDSGQMLTVKVEINSMQIIKEKS